MEEWRPVVGWEGRYEVSSVGRVRSLKTNKPIAVRLIEKKKGYLHVTLRMGRKVHKMKRVHRLVAEAFLERKWPDMVVDHINFIKSDNRVENLRWLTDAENCRRQPQGNY